MPYPTWATSASTHATSTRGATRYITRTGDKSDGDIKTEIPDHEVLCAGFPCQPFNESETSWG